MAGSVEGAGFWLPPEFLTDDDFLIEKQNFAQSNKTNSESDFCFPTEFPYDFPTDGVERLQKLLVTPALPPSAAAQLGSWAGWGVGNGSPKGVLSPPMTPLGAQYDAVGDLIYRAAGQVAKLKLRGGDGFVPSQAHKDFFAPPRSHYQFHNSAVLMSLYKQQNENSGMWNYNSEQQTPHYRGMFQVQAARDRTVLWGRSGGGGSGGGGGGGGAAMAKRACAGTGVFLPRRYGRDEDSKPHSSDARKKPGCSPAQFPFASSPNAHTKIFDHTVFAQPQPQPQPQLQLQPSCIYAPDYDWMMAQRHAALLQQQRSLVTSLLEEPPKNFPHEWTY